MLDLSRLTDGCRLTLGRYNYSQTHGESLLPDHEHGNAMEICFLVRGQQTFAVGGRDYRMRGGDIFMTFPHEVHSSGGNPMEKGELYWLIIVFPPRRDAFLHLPPRQSRRLVRALLALEPRHFRGTWKMKEQLDTALVACEQPRSPVQAYEITNQIGAFLLELLAAAQKAPGRPSPPGLKPVLDHIERHLDAPLSVPVLAQRAGISEARFKARFKAEVGIPPGEYVLRKKVEAARRQLSRAGASVTRIAFDLGFSSSQYFATVYKRYTGRTPSQDRAAGRPA